MDLCNVLRFVNVAAAVSPACSGDAANISEADDNCSSYAAPQTILLWVTVIVAHVKNWHWLSSVNSSQSVAGTEIAPRTIEVSCGMKALMDIYST